MGDLMLHVATSLLLASAVPVEAVPEQPQASLQTQIVERTYLKAAPGQRDALAKFIVANWFELDRRAKEQGLFTYYRLAENLDLDANWDFDQDTDVQAQFGEIRKAHKTILIDGKSLNELGRIVRNDRIRPREEG
jgi:hypothetical protein